MKNHSVVKYYTGVGSRSLPYGMYEFMVRIGYQLARQDFILRSGGADGADSAFYEGALCYAEETNTEVLADIYIPWNGFNTHVAGAKGIINPAAIRQELWATAHQTASEIHPAWDSCSVPAKKLHARNCFQVLGHQLDTPSNFLICWAPPILTGESRTIKGGTRTAWELAKREGVRVFNLAEDSDYESILKRIQELEKI